MFNIPAHAPPRTDVPVCTGRQVKHDGKLNYIKLWVCFSRAFPGDLSRSNYFDVHVEKSMAKVTIFQSYKLTQTNFIRGCIKGHNSTSKMLPQVASHLSKLTELCLKIQKENPKDSAFSLRVAYSKRSCTTLRHLQYWVCRVSQKTLSHMSHSLSCIYCIVLKLPLHSQIVSLISVTPQACH